MIFANFRELFCAIFEHLPCDLNPAGKRAIPCPATAPLRSAGIFAACAPAGRACRLRPREEVRAQRACLQIAAASLPGLTNIHFSTIFPHSSPKFSLKIQIS